MIWIDDAYPDVADRMAERAELMRIAAVSALQRSRNGKDLDEHARKWAFFWAARLPLGRRLSTGETE
jgi:hypothetical protein